MILFMEAFFPLNMAPEFFIFKLAKFLGQYYIFLAHVYCRIYSSASITYSTLYTIV